jgi:histidinol dehydrogenase
VKQAQGFAEAAKLVVRADPLSSLSGQQSLLDSIERAYGERLTPAAVVERILADVRSDGDAAIVRHTQLISGIRLQSLEIPSLDVSTALDRIDSSLASALQLAASRVQKYHEAFAPRAGTHFVDAHLGRRVLPLDRVGLYVPGGRFAYPSSVLMTAIPAKVAGVREVIVATPPNQQGGIGEVTLAACAIAGVDRVFALGGAQAVAALAYGTESVPRVDKICGPAMSSSLLPRRWSSGVLRSTVSPGQARFSSSLMPQLPLSTAPQICWLRRSMTRRRWWSC